MEVSRLWAGVCGVCCVGCGRAREALLGVPTVTAQGGDLSRLHGNTVSPASRFKAQGSPHRMLTRPQPEEAPFCPGSSPVTCTLRLRMSPPSPACPLWATQRCPSCIPSQHIPSVPPQFPLSHSHSHSHAPTTHTTHSHNYTCSQFTFTLTQVHTRADSAL